MKKVIQISIDVTKIDKAKLYQGAKGTYLNATLFLNEETDQYGNNGMIVQSVTLQERQAGVKGAILGNAKSKPSATIDIRTKHASRSCRGRFTLLIWKPYF
jgi:hypothetical protein